MNSEQYKTNGSIIDILVTAGEHLHVRDYVFISAITNQLYTGGRAYKVPIILLSYDSKYTAGFALSDANAGDPVYVRSMGVVDGFTGLTVGGILYPSITVAGELQEAAIPTVPPQEGSFIAGIALASDRVLIQSAYGDEEGVTP
jgi:hypothetical protein